MSLERGCVCCSLRSDLVEALKELERRAGASGQPFDAVLLETTGVADPGPVVRLCWFCGAVGLLSSGMRGLVLR